MAEREGNPLTRRDGLLHDVLEAQHHPQLPLQLLLVGSTFCQVADRLGTTASRCQLTVTSTQWHRWGRPGSSPAGRSRRPEGWRDPGRG